MTGDKTAVVIEDEPDIREVIRHNLAREGFSVLTAADGGRGLDLIASEDIDLVVLDLMLPEVDGLEVCRRIRADRATASIPIVMVTAKGEEADIVLGLELGADDYVTKPFSPRELVARTKAVLRRGGRRAEYASPDRIEITGLVIDAERHEVLVDRKPTALTATEFKLLHCLAKRPGRVFTRRQLLDKVAGEGVYVIDRNIDVHVQAIRRKLGARRELIETVRAIGYRFRSSREF